MKVLEIVTKHCGICFKEIKGYSLLSLLNINNILCDECSTSLKAHFKAFYIGAIKATAIYEYDETIKSLIYKFKGCYDYELKDVFLYRYINYLKMLYSGYVVVPVPSNEIDDQKRGFNHVVEIYKQLNLPIIRCLKKTTREKQSSKNSKDRLNMKGKMTITNKEEIENKKVLIVDDVFTTGATMRKAISLVSEAKVKDIKVLVISKTIDLNKRGKS